MLILPMLAFLGCRDWHKNWYQFGRFVSSSVSFSMKKALECKRCLSPRRKEGAI